ncbi:hypothetical protein E2C01_052420 [Portunus trituberculatus]|uniref:Uncharacterized protein n=1 Tax=Portunus trituberculatus TaxID=210409 RepID=A0A5B7GLT9_PORTR|nr:hypothetical protein [Portunus trituberculatus]
MSGGSCWSSSVRGVLLLPRAAVKCGASRVPAVGGDGPTTGQLSEAVEEVVLMHRHLQERNHLRDEWRSEWISVGEC